MRKIIAYLLYYIFFFKIKKETRKCDRILSIYGHNPSRNSFEELMKWFIDHNYHFVTLDELYAYLNGSELDTKKNVWLSFDDGWKSNYDNVFPVLKKYKIPATIFIATKGIQDGFFWFNKAFQNRQSPFYKEVQELWEMSNVDRIKIISKLEIDIKQRFTMIPKELSEMEQSGLISWGNHTHDHVMSDKCSENELKEEIQKCSSLMKEWTGDNVDFIYSYPNGNKDDLSIKVIKEMDFALAASTFLGSIHHDTDRYMLPRNEFKDNASLMENILQSYGLWTPFFNNIKHVFCIRNKK